MRILLTHSSADLYGSDRMARVTAEALIREGHDVTVELPVWGPLVDELTNAGAVVRVVRLDSVLRKSDLGGLRRLLRAVAGQVRATIRSLRFLRTEKYSLVYCNTMTQPSYLLAARIAGVPSICHVREGEEQLSRVLQRALCMPLKMAKKVVANSLNTKNFLQKNGVKEVSVVYNGKSWSEYILREKAIASDVLRVVVVGRLSPRKGQDLAIEAIRELRNRGIEVKLRIVGNVFSGYEWYEKQLREMAADSVLGSTVEFVGFKQDISNDLAWADVLLVPSRIEPFGTVAIEGMVAGKVVVVANVGGLPEIVDSDECGHVVSCTAKAIADKLAEINAEPHEQRVRLGISAKRSASDRFSERAYSRSVSSIALSIGALDI